MKNFSRVVALGLLVVAGTRCSWWDNDGPLVRPDAGAADSSGGLDQAGASETGGIDSVTADGALADVGERVDRGVVAEVGAGDVVDSPLAELGSTEVPRIDGPLPEDALGIDGPRVDTSGGDAVPIDSRNEVDGAVGGEVSGAIVDSRGSG